MTYKHIIVEERFSGQVTEIRLASPPANILSSAMMGEIREQLQKDRKTAGTVSKKLIIFTGEGAHFSFGASVEEHTADKVGAMLPAFHQMIGEIIDCPVPTLARVSGLCLGGGFELALACTFGFAEDGAKFAVPEIQLGVFPPVAAALLPALAGGTFASRMILTGEKLPARELLSASLLTQVTEQGKLDATITAFIEQQILPKSASSLKIAHQASRMVVSDIYRTAISRLEKLYLGELMSTKDAIEGINSFMEKRAPKWVNS